MCVCTKVQDSPLYMYIVSSLYMYIITIALPVAYTSLCASVVYIHTSIAMCVCVRMALAVFVNRKDIITLFCTAIDSGLYTYIVTIYSPASGLYHSLNSQLSGVILSDPLKLLDFVCCIAQS